MRKKKSQRPEQDALGEFVNQLQAAQENAYNEEQDGRPTLARSTPYGYRALGSMYEKGIITAMRYARRCGYSASWIANELDRRGITKRGQVWTTRAIRWILRPYKDIKGDTDDKGYLAYAFDQIAQMKKNIENLSVAY